jgi:muramoyltetrapeptide carboxypeptidase
LESIKGIVVGSMTKMKDNDIPWVKNAIEIIEDVTKIQHSILYNFPAGHIQDNRALILGHTVTLDVQEKEGRLPLNN